MIRFAVILLSISSAVLAEERSPEHVARAYFQAIQASDWKRVAAEFTPEAQARFRSMMVEILEAVPVPERSSVYASLFAAPNAPDQITALSNADFLARLLATIMGRALGAVQFQRVEVVGTVTERPEIVHAVCRTFMGSAVAGDLAIERMVVVSLERGTSGWGIALSGEIKGMAAMLKAQLSKAGKR